ncbi:MAG: FHA domain-containing protein, partial [Planctomycetota bacterium]
MPPKLIDNRSNKEILLKEFPFSVGRTGCHWNIPTDGISEKHLMLYLEVGKYFVEDKGSQTGTYLDNRLVEKKTQIRDGQILKIAVTEKWPAGVKDLTFKCEDEEHDKISLEDLDILQEDETDTENDKIEARHFVCHITSKGFLKGASKIRVPLEKLTKERIRFLSAFSYKKGEKLS